MSLEMLDRTQWNYAEALAHVQTVTVARRAVEAAKQPAQQHTLHRHWGQPEDLATRWKAEAETELLVALRDGDLIAKGRYTEERTHGWGGHGNSTGFGLHSGHHTSVRPEEWREGKYLMGRLTGLTWEFIDIRMPRFMVTTIWPEFVPEAPRPAQSDRTAPYTTPYLDLMQAAIAHFGITDENQGKKDCLTDWFLTQQIEGEPVSRNLADAMATLIRLPSAQRGGAKRVLGPDLRNVG